MGDRGVEHRLDARVTDRGAHRGSLGFQQVGETFSAVLTAAFVEGTRGEQSDPFTIAGLGAEGSLGDQSGRDDVLTRQVVAPHVEAVIESLDRGRGEIPRRRGSYDGWERLTVHHAGSSAGELVLGSGSVVAVFAR